MDKQKLKSEKNLRDRFTSVLRFFFMILQNKILLFLFFVVLKTNFGFSQVKIFVPEIVSNMFKRDQHVKMLNIFDQKSVLDSLRSMRLIDQQIRENNLITLYDQNLDSIQQVKVMRFFNSYKGFQCFNSEYWQEVIDIYRLLFNHSMYDYSKQIEKSILKSKDNDMSTNNDLLIFYNEYCWNIIYKSLSYYKCYPILDNIDLLKNSVSRNTLVRHLNFFHSKQFTYVFVPSKRYNWNELIKDGKDRGLQGMPPYYLQDYFEKIVKGNQLNREYSYIFLFSNSKPAIKFPLLNTEICF